MSSYKNTKGYFANTWVLANRHVVWRTLRGFFRAWVLRKNTLRSIEIYPTMQCNLSCKMCSVEKFKKIKGRTLDLADYEKIARQGARLGAMSLTVLGGEPLMADNLEDILSVFKEKHFYTHMVSNSMLISRERLTRLRDAGLNGVCLSLDSMDREKNDQIRGVKGHYKKVQESIKLARELGLVVNLAPVFFPNELENGIEVVRFCQKEGLGASGTQVAPVGAWEGGPLLSPQENDEIRGLLKVYPRLTFDWALSYFMKMRCPAGKEKIAITNYGDVFGCVINPISFGNICEESLSRILKRMQSLPEIKQDVPVCIAAEHTPYIDKYLRPLSRFDHYPVNYREHPAIHLK